MRGSHASNSIRSLAGVASESSLELSSRLQALFKTIGLIACRFYVHYMTQAQIRLAPMPRPPRIRSAMQIIR